MAALRVLGALLVLGPLAYWLGLSLLLPLLASLAALAVLSPSSAHRLWIVIQTLPRDLHFVWRAVNCLILVKRWERRDMCVADVFDKNVRAHPNKVLIHFDGEDWTFQRVADYSNRVANVFERAGYKKGDVVALDMTNRPEYVCIWLGLSKLGVISALINHHQRSSALLHSLRIAKCRAVIFGADLAQAVLEVIGELEGPLELYQLGTQASEAPEAPEAPETAAAVKDLKSLLDAAPTSEPKATRPSYKDPLIYIYTSGTTGLPKAAKIMHSRYISAGHAVARLLGMNKEDVVYNPLPLYHSAGGMCAMGYGLMYGLTVVLKTKFSASNFIPDCVKHKCTVVQYIGEICRYVLVTPPQPADTQHRVRLMLGNGMRPGVWRQFVDRFNVPHIAELYGSTEGNVTFFNIDNKLGAVGFLPRFLPLSRYPIGFVRVDQETGVIIRNKDGLCERCDINEPGMLVGYISETDPSREFHGYLDESSSEKKILRDVYEKGDKWFMTGDILVMDELGYIYFRDRTGDTFRWKGENVSTAEVESAITASIGGERDVAVYGVEVAGSEGRAGMAAIADPDDTLDLDELAMSLDRHLPSYARPLFLRKAEKLEKTSTFKIIKVTLQKEGYDPSLVGGDVLYVRSGKSYIRLTPDTFQDISSGKMRL